jgi:outer membrane protein
MKKLSVLLLAYFLFVPWAQAHQGGDWIVKAGIANVDPYSSSGPVVIGGVPQAGTGVSVDSGPTAYINIGYAFTDNLVLELLADITSKHDVNATGGLAGLGKIAEVNTLPPTLTLQWHFSPKGKFQPYLGAGLNYTTFLDETTTGSLNNALGGPSSLSADSSWGLALQAGADIMLNEKWFLNLNVYWIDIDTTASISSPAGPVSVDVQVDPWVYGIGIGTTF